jgi:hypothetical protein
MFFGPVFNPASRDDPHPTQNVILFLFVQEQAKAFLDQAVTGILQHLNPGQVKPSVRPQVE